ncbi:MAG TPA: 2'-5' RNA ligase family protein [Candidatus Paceibacterota bacterium]
MQLYFVAHRINGEAADYYAQLTKNIEKHFGLPALVRRSPAHITLKPPFTADDVSGVRARLAELAAEMPPLPLTIRGFDTFRQRTLYLHIVMAPELLERGSHLATELGELVDGKSVPLPIKMHVSVARKLAPGLYKRIMQYLEALPDPYFESTFDNLTLFRNVGGKWIVEETYLLH